ncbi:asparagine synthase (glutamine-hydrolyzing) [Algoriphagus marinus]|uniref:asparagine synthase (glutamine-hydrolyzing) n=1 Tax=Algoriphagus marinus TaxID=1925762 RepID=UPI00094BA512|nr:asparagine synthase (glutamine-hydrolyzing) [Algoriphagus marinus]
MCGILGSVNITFKQQLLDQIKHRGPDDWGIENFTIENHTVTLGQRRLSILDLSPAGHQPMISNCGNYAIIFNGEIYNHQDLRNTLNKDLIFKGHSDTESILYYLIENGIRGVKEFNGIFAIAFLDLKKGLLFLARDPFGVKPLYYYEKDEKFIFSSEIRPVKSQIEFKELDKDALSCLLRLRYNPSPQTLYKNLKKIHPGHFIEINLNLEDISISEASYLEKKSPELPNTKQSNEVLIYGDFFQKAVKRQLLSDVPVGILLSGGIDSAMVAAVAQKHSDIPLKAFTIGFEGDHYEDEINDAFRTAEILGLEHHVKRIGFDDFLSKFKECARIVEEPLATTSIIPMYYLSELASKHVKVVLTGQGADEPLGGYPKYKTELLLHNIPGIIQKVIKSILSGYHFKNEKIYRGVNAIGITNELQRFLKIYEVFSNSEIKELIGHQDTTSIDRIKYFYEILECSNKKHSVERMMAIDTRMNLADDLLNYTDKITMNFALECRVPILDLELVNYVEQLPYQSKLNFSNGKLIHKAFAKKLLPDEIINRKKKDFSSPTSYWFKSESDSIKNILLDNKTLFGKVFNQKKVAEIIMQHEKGYPREKQIFLLLGVYYFLENFNS